MISCGILGMVIVLVLTGVGCFAFEGSEDIGVVSHGWKDERKKNTRRFFLLSARTFKRQPDLQFQLEAVVRSPRASELGLSCNAHSMVCHIPRWCDFLLEETTFMP